MLQRKRASIGRASTIFTGTWPPAKCGIAPYSRNLAVALARHGCAVDVVTSAGPCRHEEDVQVMQLPNWSVRSIIGVLKHLRRQPARILHLQHPTRATRFSPGAYLLPLLARLMCPQHRVITTFHYLRPVSLKSLAVRAWFLLPATASHAVVVTVEHEARYARRLLRGKPIYIIPAGSTFPVARFSLGERARARAEAGFEPEDFVVAYFGFLLPNKGVETLLHTLAHLPDSTKAIVIGGEYDQGSGYLDSLQQTARELGLEARIRWTGHVLEHDIGRHLFLADCAALPFDEGISLKRSSLFAALEAELPVVTTEGPELSPSMRHGETLMLVPPRDAGSLAQAIDTLRLDPALRQRLRENRHRILDAVSWDGIVDRHLAIYQTLIPRCID